MQIKVDCELLALEGMKLYDLLKIAQTSEQCAQIASDVFRKKHSFKLVIIKGTFFPYPEDTLNNEYMIIIQNLEILNTFFQTFGHLVINISAEFGFLESNERIATVELISKYSSDSIIELSLDSFDKNLRSLFTKPMKRVEKLKIIGCNTDKPEFKDLKLSELFPALRQLNLPNVDPKDPSIFNEKFPNIEHFNMNLYKFGWHFPKEASQEMAKKNIANFLQKNSHLKSVFFDKCYSIDFVKIAHDHLKQIESLGINFLSETNYTYSGDKMNFPTVKTLLTIWTGYNLSNVMSFNNLEELTLVCLDPNCAEVAKRNGNLIKLNLIVDSGSQTTYFDDNDILEIGVKQSNLKDLLISMTLGHLRPRAETIMKLVQQNDKLEHIRLNFKSKTMYETLLRHFERGWIVTGDKSYTDLMREP